jgi:alpha-L-fucosidase 2
MPIGNGDIGLNVWVEEQGDLVFFIGKTDAWDENGVLLKLTKVRVRFTPSLHVPGNAFRWELKLRKGEIQMTSGQPDNRMRVVVWVDANRPVIHIDASGPQAFDVETVLEPWRTREESCYAHGLGKQSRLRKEDRYPMIHSADIIAPNPGDRIIWYHRNQTSCYPITLKNQQLDELLDTYPDPLINRTFGGCIKADGMEAADDMRLKSSKPRTQFSVAVHVLTARTATSDEWLTQLRRQVTVTESTPFDTAKVQHHEWWKRFWERSWIYVMPRDTAQGNRADKVPGATAADWLKEAETVTRGYVLQRWVNACGGRGAYPIKFNGSIFNVDGVHSGGRNKGQYYTADFRLWGGMYWWQNTRLPYYTMLAAGDFDLMQPMFAMYRNSLELRRDTTKLRFGHEGALFPETMYFWGTYGNRDYGWGNAGPDIVNTAITYEWQGAIELASMMLDYYDITEDRAFFREMIVPHARATIAFFDRHWDRDKEGKLRFDPARALEWRHDAVNPMPEVAGLHYVIGRMLKQPEELVSRSDRSAWSKVFEDLPPLPMGEEDGKAFLLPVQEFKHVSIAKGCMPGENPDLYAIFPYKLYGLAAGGLDVARETVNRRGINRTGGWRQNAIHFAYVGRERDAARLVAKNFSTWNKESRFPAFWGPNADWIPDQDHGSVAMIALQSMLLQTSGSKIVLLPAWPVEWDVDFKLHAPRRVTVEGRFKSGELQELIVRNGADTAAKIPVIYGEGMVMVSLKAGGSKSIPATDFVKRMKTKTGE